MTISIKDNENSKTHFLYNIIMKNVEVNGLWVSDNNKLSDISLICINSYLRHGHKFVLWSYSKNLENIPEGCVLKDASEILEEKFAYKDVINSYGHFSDWWRWKFLYDKGGFWTDMDVCCLSEEIPERKGFHICSMTDSLFDAMVGTLMIPKGYSVSYKMLEICKEPYKITEFDLGQLRMLKEGVLRQWNTREDLLKNAVYPSTYRCFGHVLKKYGVNKKVLLPHDTIYPITYENIKKLTTPNLKLKDFLTENTCAVHLWGSHHAQYIEIYKSLPCIMSELYFEYCGKQKQP